MVLFLLLLLPFLRFRASSSKSGDDLFIRQMNKVDTISNLSLSLYVDASKRRKTYLPQRRQTLVDVGPLLETSSCGSSRIGSFGTGEIDQAVRG